MIISKMLANMVQFLSEAFIRIFSPTDDAYPVTGFQPFTGVPHRRGRTAYW